MKSQQLSLCESCDLIQASDSDRSERPQRWLTDALWKCAFGLFFSSIRHKSTYESERAIEQKFLPQRSQRVAEGSQFIFLPLRSSVTSAVSAPSSLLHGLGQLGQ
jgi:hypothetical protein